ncbi:MAG: hypothetical protein WBW04_19595 [Nitrolancea sp.]
MVRLRHALQHRLPLVLLSLALVVATGFFLGAMWNAYQSTNPNATANATASPFSNPTVFHSGVARINTMTRSGETVLCAQVGANGGCTAQDGVDPMSMMAGIDGETYVAIVDPQRRISHVVFDFGDEQLDLDSDDGGLSVSASLSREPNSFTAYDQEGNVISVQPRK